MSDTTIIEKNSGETVAKEGNVWESKLDENGLKRFEEIVPEIFAEKNIELNPDDFLLKTKKQIYRQFTEQQAPIILQGKSFKDYIIEKYQSNAEEQREDLEILIIKKYLQSKIVTYIKENSDTALVKLLEQNSTEQEDLKKKIEKQQGAIKKISNQIEGLELQLSGLNEDIVKTTNLLNGLEKYQKCFVEPSLIDELKLMRGGPIKSKELLENLQEIVSLSESKKQQTDPKLSKVFLERLNSALELMRKKQEEYERSLAEKYQLDKEISSLKEPEKQLTAPELSEVLLEKAICSLELMKKEREEYERIFVEKYQLDKEMFLDKEKVLNKVKELNAKKQELKKELPNLKRLQEEIDEKTGEQAREELLLEEQLSSLNKLKLEEENLQKKIIDELFEAYWSEEHQANDDTQRAVLFNEFILQEALLHEYIEFIGEISKLALEEKATEVEAIQKLAFFALYCHEGKHEQVAQRIIDEYNLDGFIEKGFDKQTTYSVSLNEDGTVDYTTKVEFRNTTETGDDKFISITTKVNIKYEHIESDRPTVSFTPKLKSCEIAADNGTAEELSQLEKDNDLQLTVYVEPRDVVFKLFKAVQVEKFSPGQIREQIAPEDKGKVVGMLAGCEQQDINSTQNHVKQNKTFSTAGSVRQPLVEIAGSQPANIENKSINVQYLLIKTAKVVFKQLPEAKLIFRAMISVCEKLVEKLGLPIFKKSSKLKKIAEASSNAQGINFSKMQKALGAKQPLKQGTQAAVPATTSTLKAEAKKQATSEAPLNSSGATNENPNNESTKDQQTETNPKGKQKSPDYHWYVRRNLTL